MALALKRKRNKAKVFVLLGDGELYEGSNWEAIMFAAHHRLNNLFLIVDNNKISMLDYCKNIIDLYPLEDKFKVFNYTTRVVNGHDIRELYKVFLELKKDKSPYPKTLIADTKKGKGVSCLEEDALCHIKSLKANEVDTLIKRLK